MATSWRHFPATLFAALPAAKPTRAALLACILRPACLLPPACILPTGCLPHPASAAPIGFDRGLRSVVNEADAIAVVTVGATRTTHSTSVVTLQVLDILKGALPGSIEASYDAGPARSLLGFSADGLAGGANGNTAMVFLSAPGESGRRSLCPLTGGAPPLQYAFLLANQSGDVELPARKPDDSALVKVIQELARTAAVQPVSDAWKLQSLASDRDTDPEVPNVLRDIFQALSSAPDRRIAHRGVSALLALGQIEGLLALENALLLHPDDVVEQHWPEALGSDYRSESPQGTAVLERLIAPGVPAPLRKAAALALAKVNAPHMVPLLARLLDDPDVELRATAVLGLSMFCAGFRVSGPQRREGEWPFLEVEPMTWALFDLDAIRKREQEYSPYWRGWWAANQQRVRALAASGQAGP